MTVITRHRPTVHTRVAVTGDGLTWVHQVRCTCGETFPAHYSRPKAKADREAHISAVRAPADSTCREPQQHHSKPWDLCPLCAWQDPLPGF